MSSTSINNIPWNKLWHAYGTAEDVPQIIQTLLTGDADARKKARLLYICGNLCHQGTRYSASAAVVPFLVELLKNPECPDKHELIYLLLNLAFGSDELVPPEMITPPNRPEWESLIDLNGLSLEDFETKWQKGEIVLEDEQINVLAKLWEWNAYNAVASQAEVFCEFVNWEFDDELRMAAGYAIAHFPNIAGKSIPILRATLKAEQSARHRLNLLFALALLDRATGDHGDVQWFQTIFEQDKETRVKLAAAVALATVQGENVSDSVFQHLLDHLECVDQKLHLYCWGVWNEGDLTGIVANVLKYVGRGREADVIPILTSTVQRISPGPGFRLAYALLDFIFKRGNDGKPRSPTELNPMEKEALDILAKSDHWRVWMGYSYGLPCKTDDIRRWGNVWYRL